MKIKKLVALVMATMLLTSIFAGGSKDDKKEGSASEGPVTIKVSVWDNAQAPHMDLLIAAFEAENPNIKVELIDIPGTEYSNKLTIMLNGGSDLDAFFVKDAAYAKAFWNKGQVEDLIPYVEADGLDLDMYKGLAEGFAFDNEQAGLPFRTDYYVLYYNKDIFDAAGVDYPSNDITWAEFEELAKQITAGSGSTKNYGALLHHWAGCVQNWAVQGGDFTMMEPDEYDNFKPYYEMALRMQNDDETIMKYGTMKTGNIHYSSPFLTGNVGMMPMGSWFMATIIDKIKAGESDINWGVATLPHAEDIPAGSVVGATTPLAMNSNSDKKEAAWKFVKFATGLEAAKILAGTGAIPGVVTDEVLDILVNIDGMPEGTAKALEYNSIVLDRPVADRVGEVNLMLTEEHGLIMLSENSVDDGIENMTKRAKEILSN